LSDISREQKFVGLFFFFFLLFNFPLLGVLDKKGAWASVPVIIYYMGGIWLGAIVLAAYWLNRKSGPWKNR
jgi:hypothetical protein